ncbi:response regulator transcription factor [Gottschalkiaceae bacterium SANA]|nr:response regulator transcription factor [Gottschalkiaceae bacterium SANA]
MKAILVADDEKKIREFIRFFLEREGYSVIEASNGKEAVACLREKEVSLIILDLLMPEMNGFEACESIRTFSDVPILMLTAVEGEQDHIDGYTAGADDYITKPFKIKILLAKINRILGKNNQGFLQVQELKINFESKQVMVEESQVVLAPKEYELLEYMVANKNIVLSRERILEYVWGYDFEGGTRVVDNHIKKLRGKLDSFSRRIKTVVGSGYKIEG